MFSIEFFEFVLIIFLK